VSNSSTAQHEVLHGRRGGNAALPQAAARVISGTGRRPLLRGRHSALIEIMCLESEQAHLLSVPAAGADIVIGRMLAAAGAAVEEFCALTHAAADRGRAAQPPRVEPGAVPASAAGSAARRRSSAARRAPSRAKGTGQRPEVSRRNP
jgi:hypothetical protein